ncbi:magnesium transporter MRS2-11, chloroplastic isoform X1 [Primulina tabacum]|uniref:magnesium transporter MRS2-11, chloroplastic isoform X1 n=1 Tax=Primulina tabacum TaxID=48773 RepID=UPI003F59BAEE
MAASLPFSSPNYINLPLHLAQFPVILPGGISFSSGKYELISRKLLVLERSWVPRNYIRCFAEEEGAGEIVSRDGDDEDVPIADVIDKGFSNGAVGSQRIVSAGDSSLSLGIRDPIYEVVEVRSNGIVSTRKINRRNLLKSSGLRPRDIRSVDPSLWLTNSMPSLLVETLNHYRLLLDLKYGSMQFYLIWDLCGQLRCKNMFIYLIITGGKAFIDALLPRLNPKNVNGGPSMPFVLEVVEAALHSRIQRLERRLMDLEPSVQALLEVLPNRLTGIILEELRTSKQTLVELGSRAGALKQMLLDILEDTHEIRRICVLGRNCTLKKNNEIECAVPCEKEIAEEEEEEIEMLLENYLQRCESCHGQAERLLDSAKEMEDSIAVNLSSRRLEVSRVELLLQVGTFCVAVGALIAGIFGMNLRSYLEEHVFAFWLMTGGIFVGAVIGFFLMYSYLKKRKIL